MNELGVLAVTTGDLEGLRDFCHKIDFVLKNQNRKKILIFLAENGPMTRFEVQEKTQDKLASVHLSRLLEACLVKRDKERPFRYSVNSFLLDLLGIKLVHDELRKKKEPNIFRQSSRGG